MTRFSGKGFLFVLSLLFVATACDSGDEDPPETAFEEADTNASGGVGLNEFGAFLQQSQFLAFLARHDEDGDGGLSEEEFGRVVFFIADPQSEENPDGDGISEGDFNEVVDLFFNVEEGPTFGDHDADEDGALEEEEFQVAFAEARVFENFDADEDEFNGGVGALFNLELPRPQ